MRRVLETAKKVAEESLRVEIDKEALSRFSKKLFAEGIQVPPWEQVYHFSGDGKMIVSYLLVLDSLNFCFWPESGKSKWEIDYGSGRLSGYYALAVSLKRACESGTPITSADYLARLSLGKFTEILGGRGELQLMAERVQVLNELGNFLLDEFMGEAHNLVEDARNSAEQLALCLGEKLVSFRDIATYKGYKVFFYKRAQIFAADLFGALKGKGWGGFTDMDRLTAFADYKVPQVLRHVGILRYKRELAQKVEQQILLKAGSTEEVEIRANTVWAVELIRQELERLGKRLAPFEIDWILWNTGQGEDFRGKPYHRTVTIFY